MRLHLALLLPLYLGSIRGCNALQDWQLTAQAYQDCGRVTGGGDLVTQADLVALSNLATGNSGAAITRRFGLPEAYCGTRVYYPVATDGESLWVWIDIPPSGLAGWNYTTILPLGGQP